MKRRTALEKNILICPTSYTMNAPALILRDSLAQISSRRRITKIVRYAKNINRLIMNEVKLPNLNILNYVRNMQDVKIHMSNNFCLEFHKTIPIDSPQDESIHFKMFMSSSIVQSQVVLIQNSLHDILRCFRNIKKNTKIYLHIENLSLPEGIALVEKFNDFVSQIETFIVKLIIQKNDPENICLLKPFIQRAEFLYIGYPRLDIYDKQVINLTKGEQKILQLSFKDTHLMPVIQDVVQECSHVKTLYIKNINSITRSLENFCIPVTLKCLFITLKHERFKEVYPISSFIPDLQNTIKDADSLEEFHITTPSYQKNPIEEFIDLHKLLCMRNLRRYTFCMSDDPRIIERSSVEDKKINLILLEDEKPAQSPFFLKLLETIEPSKNPSFMIEVKIPDNKILDSVTLKPLLEKIDLLCIRCANFSEKAKFKHLSNEITRSNKVLQLLIGKERQTSGISELVQKCQNLTGFYLDEIDLMINSDKINYLAPTLRYLFIDYTRKDVDKRVVFPIKNLNCLLEEAKSLTDVYFHPKIFLGDERESSQSLLQLPLAQNIKNYATNYSLPELSTESERAMNIICNKLIQMKDLEDLKLHLELKVDFSYNVMQKMIDTAFLKLKYLELAIFWKSQDYTDNIVNSICFILDGLLGLKNLQSIFLNFKYLQCKYKLNFYQEISKLKTFHVDRISDAITISKRENLADFQYEDFRISHDRGVLSRIGVYIYRYGNREHETKRHESDSVSSSNTSNSILPDITLSSQNLFSSLFSPQKGVMKGDCKQEETMNSGEASNSKSNAKVVDSSKTSANLFGAIGMSSQEINNTKEQSQKQIGLSWLKESTFNAGVSHKKNSNRNEAWFSVGAKKDSGNNTKAFLPSIISPNKSSTASAESLINQSQNLFSSNSAFGLNATSEKSEVSVENPFLKYSSKPKDDNTDKLQNLFAFNIKLDLASTNSEHK